VRLRNWQVGGGREASAVGNSHDGSVVYENPLWEPQEPHAVLRRHRGPRDRLRPTHLAGTYLGATRCYRF
jgi:hypothetical protein